jgi:hypothetical protein
MIRLAVLAVLTFAAWIVYNAESRLASTRPTAHASSQEDCCKKASDI